MQTADFRIHRCDDAGGTRQTPAWILEEYSLKKNLGNPVGLPSQIHLEGACAHQAPQPQGAGNG